MDIMYQMMHDEKKFGLDLKSEQLLNGNLPDTKNNTRSELLSKVAADLEAARKFSK